MDPVIDILVCAIFLFVVIGSKFNKWPAEQSKLFVGKPSDYIDAHRYYGYCLIYVLTYFAITIILFNAPELLNSFSLEGSIPISYTAFGVAIVSLSMLQQVAPYDEQWRQKLHGWARIPYSVKEITNDIVSLDSYMPTENYLSKLKREFRGKEEQTNWIDVINAIESEKADHKLGWYYIKCFSLLLIIKDKCTGLSAEDLKNKTVRIEELGRIITSPDFANDESIGYKNELEEMSQFFVECLSKYLIKKYPREDEKYIAFKNLGFQMGMHDNQEFRIKDAVSWCFLGIIIVSACSVFALQSTLDFYSQRQFLTPAKFASWTIASIVSFSIAIFVAVLAKKMPVRQKRIGIYTYINILILATLASFIFFVFAHDLNTMSSHKPFARIVLAMSFSTLAIVVVKALGNASHDHREVVISSLFHAVVLGCTMAVFQVLITVTFSWDRAIQTDSLSSFYFSDWKLPIIFTIGFMKGLLVGGVVSYAIQKTQREQLLEALRKNPRVERVFVMQLKMGEKEFDVNTRDISTRGVKVQCREKFISGETVEIESPVLGHLKGVIRWTQSKLLGRQIAGIEFIKTPNTLQKYIRDQYGEYYA